MKKLYTYSVACIVHFQFTFTEDQIESSDDGPVPTEAVLVELQNELMECIGENFAVDSVEIEEGAESCQFLGDSDEDEFGG